MPTIFQLRPLKWTVVSDFTSKEPMKRPHISDRRWNFQKALRTTCGNSTLKLLNFCHWRDGYPRRSEHLPRVVGVNNISWESLALTLLFFLSLSCTFCDQTSPKSTFNSNHTLEISYFDSDSPLPSTPEERSLDQENVSGILK